MRLQPLSFLPSRSFTLLHPSCFVHVCTLGRGWGENKRNWVVRLSYSSCLYLTFFFWTTVVSLFHFSLDYWGHDAKSDPNIVIREPILFSRSLRPIWFYERRREGKERVVGITSCRRNNFIRDTPTASRFLIPPPSLSHFPGEMPAWDTKERKTKGTVVHRRPFYLSLSVWALIWSLQGYDYEIACTCAMPPLHVVTQKR